METINFLKKVPDDVAAENRGLVQVFNAIGQCVYSGKATIIPVRQSGVYVVRVGTNVYKVLVK